MSGELFLDDLTDSTAVCVLVGKPCLGGLHHFAHISHRGGACFTDGRNYGFNQLTQRLALVAALIQQGLGTRVFYVMIDGPEMVLLHAYKKQSQKAPQSEIDTAEKRMKEVLEAG